MALCNPLGFSLGALEVRSTFSFFLTAPVFLTPPGTSCQGPKPGSSPPPPHPSGTMEEH